MKGLTVMDMLGVSFFTFIFGAISDDKDMLLFSLAFFMTAIFSDGIVILKTVYITILTCL